MPHDPHHHHHQSIGDDAGDRRVGFAVVVNLVLTLVQIVAGVFSGSLALVADAIHNLSDAMSLVIALAARRIARRPADAKMTFGYGRAEVVAALINLTTLMVIAFYLLWEGAARLLDPPEVAGWMVVIVAGVALLIDTATALLVFRMARDSVNIRAAFLHNVMDALSSVAVMVAGTLILLYDWRLVDPLVTMAIAGYILWHAGRELPPVLRVLMLGSPDAPGAERVIGAMEAVAGVADVHHVHFWLMGERDLSLDAHVVLDTGADPGAVKAALKAVLADEFHVAHSVLELESAADQCIGADRIGHPGTTTRG